MAAYTKINNILLNLQNLELKGFLMYAKYD